MEVELPNRIRMTGSMTISRSKPYKPHALFDYLHEACELKNDAELARALKVAPATISRIRSGSYNVTAEIILSIHKQTGLPVEQIESLIGDRNA